MGSEAAIFHSRQYPLCNQFTQCYPSQGNSNADHNEWVKQRSLQNVPESFREPRLGPESGEFWTSIKICFLLCVICMCLCEHVPRVYSCPQRHEEGVGFLRVTDGYDFPDLEAVC